jgi:predicted nucleic acid-binding protein
MRELDITSDPGDNRFLECAEYGKADFLVTGNKRHFPKQWSQAQVVNARELLECIVPELRR